MSTVAPYHFEPKKGSSTVYHIRTDCEWGKKIQNKVPGTGECRAICSDCISLLQKEWNTAHLAEATI